VEVTINGIGERAGNAAFEEFVMALYVRKDLLPFTTNVNTQQIYNTSRLLSNIIGFPIPRNKPVIGDNAFAHEAGIHQDGVLKHRQTYEIMTPHSVGRDSSHIVLGRHSGKHGVEKRLAELGLNLSKEDAEQVYQSFLQIADKKKEVYDEDLYVLVSDELGHKSDTYILDYFNIISGNTSVPTATIRLKSGDKIYEEAATGDGPVDAIINAIDRALGTKTRLVEYLVKAVTPGREAMGEVTVTVMIDNKKFTGRGSSTDILEASAKAYIGAINRYKNIQNSLKR
jgi:2-isopropylmalate synthase